MKMNSRLTKRKTMKMMKVFQVTKQKNQMKTTKKYRPKEKINKNDMIMLLINQDVLSNRAFIHFSPMLS